MQATIQYIIRFLLGGNHIPASLVKKIGYTKKTEEFDKFQFVIYPSDFFDDGIYGTQNSLPTLPLKIWEESPLLYGEPRMEQSGKTTILHADIIASTYFLISRYEEMVLKDIRDVHGRFPGVESLPFRAGFIDRPLVDEYGKQLRDILRESGINVPEVPKKIQKIFLTHDVDQLAHFRNVRGMVGGVLRGIRRPNEGRRAIKSFFGFLRDDPWYTFPYLYKLDTELIAKIGSERCEAITFVRSGGRQKEDKPFSNLLHPDYKTLIRYSKRKNIIIGLHSSYQSGISPELISSEKEKLERLLKTKIAYNRHHYLNAREPEDMQALLNAGITDDFTIGYADIAGFRLGTCRPVKWIDLTTKKITPLTLHSLTIMDGSLSDKRYMYMNAHEALQYCEQLINNVENYNGELVLLWHNTSVEKNPDSYHRKLYRDLLKLLQTK